MIEFELKGVEITLGTVFYKGLECKIIFDYQNGNYEIMCLEEIFLVNESQIDFYVGIE